MHLIGGGARNHPLCRLTSDACRPPVVPGPVEATAATRPPRRFEPHGDPAAWDAAAARIGRE